MDTCTKCGNPVEASQWYCSSCGSPLGIGIVHPNGGGRTTGSHHSGNGKQGEHTHSGEHEHHSHRSSHKHRWMRLRNGELRLKPVTAATLLAVALLLISAAYLFGRYVR